MLLCSLCALSFLCCLVCYRAIACFLLFKTKGSSRVKTVIKSFCCSSPWPIDLESNSFLCFQARPRATPLPGLVGLISFWKWMFLFHSPRAKGLFFCFSWSFSRSFFDFLPVWDFHFKKQRRPLFSFWLCPICRESSPLFWWCGWECFSLCLISWNLICLRTLGFFASISSICLLFLRSIWYTFLRI